MSRELSHLEYTELLAQDNVIKLAKDEVSKLACIVTAISYYNFNKSLRLMGKVCQIYVVLALEGHLYCYKCSVQEALQMFNEVAYVIFEII